MRRLLPLALAVLSFAQAELLGQSLTGRVVDDASGEPIPYAHVGIPGRNLGTVTDDAGAFELEVDGADRYDEFAVARVGYVAERLPFADVRDASDLVVPLEPAPAASPLRTALKGGSLKSSGRTKTFGPKRPGEEVACGVAGSGSELGVALEADGNLYGLKQIRLLLGGVTYDSLLLRFDVYPLTDGTPGESLLDSELLARAAQGDTWVTADLSGEGLLVDRDVVVTVEAVRGWSTRPGGRTVCYGIGTGGPSEVYVRRASMDEWHVESYPTVMLNVEVERYKL